MKKKLVCGFSILMCLLFIAGTAQATSITSLYDFEAFNKLSDQSFENLINVDGGADTTVDVGDRLTGVFRIDQLLNSAGLQNYGIDWDVELTAAFDITVQSKTGNATDGFEWVFEPTADFETAYGTGAMIAVFEDPANDYDPLTSVANAFATATNGTDYWTLGFSGGTATGGEGWEAFAPFDDFSDLTGGANAGVANFGLSLLSWTAGPELLQNQASILGDGSDVHLFGSGDFRSSTSNIWDIENNVEATFSPIPEPGSLTMLGFGLLGLARMVRRKVKK